MIRESKKISTTAVLLLVVVAVFAGLDSLPPGLVVLVPIDGVFEGFGPRAAGGLPA